jgi:hypothetical protein
LPGISSFSTDTAKALDEPMHETTVIHTTPMAPAIPLFRITRDQYTLTAMMWTITAINSMKKSGMCSTCQYENRRAYARYSDVRRPASKRRSA